VEDLRWPDHLRVMAALSGERRGDIPDESAAPGELAFTLTLKDHRWNPIRLEVPADAKVRILVRNLDPTPEQFESYDLKL